MKKILITLLFFLSFSLHLFANDMIKVDYNYMPPMENITPVLIELYKELYALQNFLGVSNSKITITGNIKDKRFVTFTHIVKDGKDSIFHTDTSMFPMWADTLIISVKSMPIDSNKVKINRNYSDRWTNENIYDIVSNKSCILMQTSLLPNDAPNACGTDWYLTTLSEVFPIIAYSIGIPMDNDIIHYCGLRDAGVHPKLWSEKFKIKNYIYFDIKFLD